MAAKPKNPRPHEVRALLDGGLTKAHEQGRGIVRTYDVRDLERMRKEAKRRK